MGKFLFIVPPLTGHINPTLSVGAELLNQGHQAAWACHEALATGFELTLKENLPDGAAFIPVRDKMTLDDYKRITEKSKKTKGIKSLKFLYEDVFIPMAKSTKTGIEEAVETFQPDVIINDQQVFAGAIVAYQKGIPYASFCTTSAGVLEPLEGFNKITEWEINQILNLQKSYGINIDEKLNSSSTLTIVFSSKTFVGENYEFPDFYKFVGPSISERTDNTDFPWEKLKNSTLPKVLISLGTVNQDIGQKFFKKIHDAFINKKILVIVISPEEFFDTIPDNFIVRKRIPQLKVIPYVDAVVSHAGHNTVCETLANGLPLIVTPIKDDQSKVASQVVAAEAGIRLKYLRFKPDDMYNAVVEVIKNPSYKQNAQRIKKSFDNAGGAKRAVDLLKELLQVNVH